MAKWWHQTRAKLIEEWVVPNGDFIQLNQAMEQAVTNCAVHRGCKVAELPDNAVQVRGTDDGVILYYEYDDPMAP